MWFCNVLIGKPCTANHCTDITLMLIIRTLHMLGFVPHSTLFFKPVKPSSNQTGNCDINGNQGLCRKIIRYGKRFWMATWSQSLLVDLNQFLTLFEGIDPYPFKLFNLFGQHSNGQFTIKVPNEWVCQIWNVLLGTIATIYCLIVMQWLKPLLRAYTSLVWCQFSREQAHNADWEGARTVNKWYCGIKSNGLEPSLAH